MMILDDAEFTNATETEIIATQEKILKIINKETREARF
jgi:hypothetical protein